MLSERVPWGAIVGQGFTAIVTVAAVYLAAKVGFEQTIRYTRYQQATDTVLVLHVVKAELLENIRILEEFEREINAMQDNGFLLVDQVFDIKSQAYDAGSMNDMYFRLGPDVIVTTRRFYDQARDVRAALSSNVRSVLENGQKVGPVRDVVHEQWRSFRPFLTQAKDELVPIIDRRIAELESVRKEAGSDVQPVPAPLPRPAPK